MDNATGTGKREALQVIGVVKDAKYEALNQAASFKTAFLAASKDADRRFRRQTGLEEIGSCLREEAAPP